VKPPVRWLDAGADAPPGARDLLGGAPLTPSFTDELRYRLGAGVAQTAALPVASGWSTLLLKGFMVAGIGAASGLAAHHLAGSHEVHPPTPPSVTAPAVPAAPTPEPMATIPVEALPALQLPTAPAAAPRLKLDPQLEEAELLEKARGLVGSNPAGALKLTAEHGRDFPKGRLRAEADLIAAQSLLAMGKVAAAKARAEASLARYPKGLYARQLREIAEH
jgi:hypothetical protein